MSYEPASKRALIKSVYKKHEINLISAAVVIVMIVVTLKNGGML